MQNPCTPFSSQIYCTRIQTTTTNKTRRRLFFLQQLPFLVWFIIIIIFVYFLPSKKSLCALVRGGYFLYIQFLIHIIIYILLLLLFSLFNCNQRHYGVKAKNKSVCVCHLLSFFLWLIIRSENSHDVVDEDIDKCRRSPLPHLL